MSRTQMVILVLLVAIVAVGGLVVARGRSSSAPPADPNAVLAYGPCGLQGPLMAAKALFAKQHPEIHLNLMLDNANVLVNRVLDKGERPDIFISPGELELKQLREKQLIDESTIRDYGSLDMVLIAPRNRKAVNSLASLGSPAVRFIAMGDPKSTSLGYYGEEVLRGLKLWKGLQSKLLLRTAPLDAVTLVEQGKADAGIAYLSCPLDTNPEKASKSSVKIIEKIPRTIYPPIRLQLGMLKACKNRKAAQTFIDFMASKQAQQVMAGDGVLPTEVIKK